MAAVWIPTCDAPVRCGDLAESNVAPTTRTRQRPLIDVESWLNLEGAGQRAADPPHYKKH